jgi:hypothetical protein
MNDQKLPAMYSLTAIGVATFLGSALAAGYMLSSNYKALGNRQMATYALWGSLIVVLAFILLPTSLEVNPTIAISMMIGQVVTVLAIANKLQGPMFKSFEEMGGQYHPVRRTILVGIGASFVLTFGWVLFITLFTSGFQPVPNG